MLLAVMAHPDDESTSVGGTLARYARSGTRTVVVTCTNGEMGDGLGGAKPGEPGHDPKQVAATRLAELAAACRELGVAHVDLLGYHDSGAATQDWRPGVPVFTTVPVAAAAARLAELLLRHRPRIVVTNDPDAGLQHQDHIRAGVITTEALRGSGIPARLYYKAHGTGHWTRLRQSLADIGIDLPAPTAEAATALADVERRITTTIDVSAVVDHKYAALHAHASQLDASLAGKLPPELFRRTFGVEEFIHTR